MGPADYRALIATLLAAGQVREKDAVHPRTAAEVQAGFAAITTHPSVVPASELAKAALPELQADWLTAIEKGWADNVGN